MYQEPLNIVDGSIYAYLLVDIKSKEILDANQLARTFYKNASTYPRLQDIFSPDMDEKTLLNITEQLKERGSVILEDIYSVKSNGEKFPCRIEICYPSDSLILLVVKEHSKKKDARQEDLIELHDNAIFVLENNEELNVLYGNQRFFQTIPMEKDELDQGGNSSFLQLLPHEKRDAFYNQVATQLDHFGECDVDVELSFGEEYFQLFRFNAYQSLLNKQLYAVLISVKKQSELMKKIEYDQQYFDIMQKFSKDLLFRVDVKNRTLVHRGDISKFVGLLAEMENFPECLRDINFIHPEDLDGFIAFAYRLMSGMESSFEPRLQFTNGQYEKYRLQGSPLFDAEGNTVQVVGKSENIQKFVDIEAKANYDSLTTTLNKQSFRELVEDILSRAVERDKFALLFLDLDDFKGVNDTHGHVFGDFLLEAVGKRISNCIRKQDRIGRVGGDEFVIFFQFAPSHEAVLERAEAILHSLRREFTKDTLSYYTKASIGIALFPEHGDTYETLYHKADLALYKSKDRGKDVATIFHEDWNK